MGIFQTDAEQKGKSPLIKVSNLQWKTTLLDLNKLFVAALGKEKEPRFLRLLEDKNGFPKNAALVLLDNAETAMAAVDTLSGHCLLGRRIECAHSCFVYDGPLFAP